MKIGGFDTSLAAAQLNQLFGIEEIFKRRGLVVSKYERRQLLFDPSEHDFPNEHFAAMHSTPFRRTLACVANAPGTRSALSVAQTVGISEEKALEHLNCAIQLRLITVSEGAYRPAQPGGFGSTLEWYVAAICLKELGSIAYWGVEIKGLSGDYDVIVVRDTQVGYIECKSGPFSSITRSDVANFLTRERLLAPQFSIFLADGTSSENAEILADRVLEASLEYELELPGIMEHSGTLETEYYNGFARVVPINAFFVGVQQRPLRSTLRRIYQFLTMVCDRNLRVENRAAKRQFGLKSRG